MTGTTVTYTFALQMYNANLNNQSPPPPKKKKIPAFILSPHS